MRLRARINGKQINIGTNLNADSTLNDLLLDLINVSKEDYNVDKLSIRVGYPPKVLDISDKNAILSNLGIKDGETFIIENLDESRKSADSNLPTISKNTSNASYSSGGSNIKTFSNLSNNSNTSNDTKNDKLAQLEAYIPFPYGGIITLRSIPDDNSCLFHSISYAFSKNMYTPNDLRYRVASYIKQHQDFYNEAILGRKVNDYCEWICKPNTWGGSIEMNILSEILEIQIDSIQISTLRIDSFGEDKNYKSRIILFYGGIHYDAAAVTEASDRLDRSKDLTLFNIIDGLPMKEDPYIACALDLAKILKDRHQFTEESSFTLKCGICNTPLVGSKKAQEHAEKTGHTDFVEY